MSSRQPEQPVSEPLVRRLVAGLPGLVPRTVVPLSAGYDRGVWLVNDELVFGFPRRAAVLPGLARELTMLPRLAPLLPLAVPSHRYVGQPGPAFPWPWVGGPLLPGVESGDAGLDEGARARIGLALAGFLRRLHSPELAERAGAGELPEDANRRSDIALRVPHIRERLAELRRRGTWDGGDRVSALLEAGARLTPAPPAATLVHGDLHFRHVLVAGGEASGIIDWIDVCRADPALDLQLVWSFLPPPARAAFLAAYGGAGEERLLRARIIAVFIAGELAHYGSAFGRPAIEREAIASLDRALAG